MLRYIPSPVELVAAIIFAIAMLAAAARGDDCGPTCAVRCFDVELHDGDTVKANISLPFGVTLVGKSIRASDYDAPEINHVRQTVKVTAAEIARGREAKSALEQLIAGGELWIEDSHHTDPYGRISARLWVKREDAWTDVAKWMTAHKHIR